MRETVLGIDFGTGGCKTTLLGTDGAFISDGYVEYRTYHTQNGWSEQKPSDWLPALSAAIALTLSKCGASSRRIAGISFSASAHNAVLLGKDGKALRDTIMWTDQRSAKESDFLTCQHGDEIFKIGYHVPAPTWTLPQLLWIKNNEPHVFSKLDSIMFLKDYVRYRLTGVCQTDYIEAQGSLLFDNVTWNWSERLCGMAGISAKILPPICKPSDRAGFITREAAALTGLAEGTPVINGASDTALENYCVGAVNPQSCVVKIATASTVNTFQTHPTPSLEMMTYAQVVEGTWSNCLATSSAAASLRWYRDTFCNIELSQESDGGRDVYQILDDEAVEVNPGSEGLYFHPYLTGERSPYWNPSLRGSFVGITARHRRGHFNRAILEGVAYSIKDNFTIAQCRQPIGRVSLVGGGSKSPLWSSILANVLNAPIDKYEHSDSSYGAAMLAGVGIGAFSGHGDAIKACVRKTDRIDPDPEISAVYAKGFQVYRDIYGSLKDIYGK